MQSSSHEYAVSEIVYFRREILFNWNQFSPHSQMPLSIAFLPTPEQRGMEFSCTITLRTPSEDGQDQILLERSLIGQWF